MSLEKALYTSLFRYIYIYRKEREKTQLRRVTINVLSVQGHRRIFFFFVDLRRNNNLRELLFLKEQKRKRKLPAPLFFIIARMKTGRITSFHMPKKRKPCFY